MLNHYEMLSKKNNCNDNTNNIINNKNKGEMKKNNIYSENKKIFKSSFNKSLNRKTFNVDIKVNVKNINADKFQTNYRENIAKYSILFRVMPVLKFCINIYK